MKNRHPAQWWGGGFHFKSAQQKSLDDMEQKYDRQFAVVFDAIRALMAEPDDETRRPRIGYATESER
jgi:hypothetical protein